MANVSGSRTINLEPSPRTVFTSTSPPRDSTLDLTTSRPTPRPEISVIFLAMEKLGINRRSIISFCVMLSALSWLITPRLIAFCLTASVSIPLPSSPTSIMTLFPSWNAFRKIVPVSGLPLAIRVAVSSRP